MSAIENRKPLAHKASHGKPLPGPSSWQMVKNTLALRDDPFGFLTQLTQDYGDICQVPLLIGPVIVLNHPDYMRHVLVEHPKLYDREDPFFSAVRLLLGRGLATIEEPLWAKERRLLQPTFHKQHLNTFSQIMTDEILSWLAGWQSDADQGKLVDITEEMRYLMLHLLNQTIFNDLHVGKQSDDLLLTLSESMKFLGQYFSMPFPPLFVATKKNRRFKHGISHLNSIIYALIEQRRSLVEPGSDLLGLLLSARDDETGEGLSELQLRDELVTFFATGSETSSNALTWVFYLLSEHAEVEARLYEEVDRVLAGRPPTPSDLLELVYTRMVIDEALRLYPPGAIVMRRSVEKQEIGGYSIPRDAKVLWSFYLLHRHHDFWEEPERFWPERFSPELRKVRHPQAYIPFSTGPHICIGQHFALMVMTLVLALIAQRYRLRMVSGQAVEPEFHLTLQPRNGLKMYVRARDNGQHNSSV